MEKLGPSTSGEDGDLLYRIDIGANRLVHRRKELDQTGTVDDEINAVAPVRILNARVNWSRVAGPDGDLVMYEVPSALIYERFEWRRVQDLFFETILSSPVFSGTDEKMDLPDFRVAIEKQGQEYFAEESVSPSKEDVAAG